MVDPQQRKLHECIRIVISHISSSAASISTRSMRVSGPQCRIDRYTFELFERYFPRGQYSQGIVNAFMEVRNLATPEELELAAREVSMARKKWGKSPVQVYMKGDELDLLNDVAAKSDISVSAVLEACVLIYVQARTICAIEIKP